MRPRMVQSWNILDAAGRHVATHERWEPGRDGRAKDCKWRQPNGAYGLGGLPVADLPLYGCDDLPADFKIPVVIVEGEKAADALRALAVAAVGTVTGAGGCPSTASLAVLAGRPVVLWPDADDPGHKHMRQVAAKIRSTASSLRIVVPPADVPKGWDAADTDADTVRRLITEAVDTPGEDGAQTDPLRVLRDLPDDADAAARTTCLREVSQALSGCDPLELTSLRVGLVEEAKRRSWPSPTRLADDVLRAAAGGTGGQNSNAAADAPAPLGLSDPKPSAEAVDTADVLVEMHETLTQYVVLPDDHAAVAVVLWCAHTWVAHAVADFSPRLHITGPTSECGKSRLLEVCGGLVHRPLDAASATPAVLFRTIEAGSPTLLLDEVDTISHDRMEEMRCVLNAGQRRGGTVLRCSGDEHEPRAFDVFGPCALSGIGDVPATVASRSVRISMQRKLKNQKVIRLRLARYEREVAQLRSRLARWAADSVPALSDAEPDLPDALGDRQQDGWEILFAIADLAGGDWPDLARRAAVALAGAASKAVADTDAGVQLLEDLREVWPPDQDRARTSVLLERLRKLEDRPWTTWGARRREPGLTSKDLAGLLRPYGARPKSVRLPDGATPKGYERKPLDEAWARYLPTDAGGPVPPSPSRNAATIPENGALDGNSIRNTDDLVAATDRSQSPSNGVCGGVAAEGGGEGADAAVMPGPRWLPTPMACGVCHLDTHEPSGTCGSCTDAGGRAAP